MPTGASAFSARPMRARLAGSASNTSPISLPLLRLRLAYPSTVVDVGRVPELRGVRDDGDAIVIGSILSTALLIGPPASALKLVNRFWVGSLDCAAVPVELNFAAGGQGYLF